jgi:predicted CxxxxCH...CXXCH cytochrome family protein
MECTFITAEKERGMRKMKPQKTLLQLAMLALVSIVSVLALSSESFAALTCYQCHGDGVSDALPRDTPYAQPSSYRNITTGAVKGNHQTHLAGFPVTVANQSLCARCHNNSGYTSNHRSGTITMNKAINTSPLATGYTTMTDSGTFLFKNQTTVPVLGTCSNVNCHFEQVTPAWGSDPAATLNCGSCHALSPTTGNHTKHLRTDNVHAVFGCNNCHANRGTYQHATSAGNAGRNIDLTGTSMVGTVVTPGNNLIMPSQAGSRTYARCSTNYCHSRGQSSNGLSSTPAAYVNPFWNTTITSCDGCHQSGLNLTTGTHSKHIVVNNDCGQCHSGAGASTMSSATHVDGFINVSGSQAVHYSQGLSSPRGNGYGTCTNTSCHSPFSPSSSPAATWGTPATDCNFCHAAVPVSGAHTIHNAMAGVSCATCHTNPGALGAGGHVNNNIDVSQGYPGIVGKHAVGVYVNTCNTQCHSTFTGSSMVTPTWGGHTLCTSCHGNNAATLTTGDHTKHLALQPALLVQGSCGTCHNGAAAGTTSGGLSHGDAIVNIGGTTNLPAVQNIPKHATGAYTTTCSTTCHNAYTGATATPTWSTAATCSSCHLGSPVTGDHTKHLTTAPALLTAGTCGTCHNGAAAGTTSGGTGHFDGRVDVGGAGTLITTPQSITKHAYNAGYTTTCSVTCHNAFTGTTVTPVWGTPATCDSCHITTGIASGDHTKHVAVAALLIQGTCGTCHNGAASGTTSGGAGHFNNTVTIGGTTQLPATQNITKHAVGTYATTCATVCHNAYTGTTATPQWGTAATCSSCHGVSAATNLTTGDHTKHLASALLPAGLCGGCHTGATNTTYTFGGTHGDGGINVGGTLSGVTLNGLAKKATAGPYTTTCNTTCHNAYNGGTVTPVWGTAANCGSCHATTPATGDHTAHLQHVTVATGAMGCGQCHAGATSTTYAFGGNHGDGNIDVAGSFTPSGNNLTKHAAGSGYISCSTVVCHNGGNGVGKFTAPAVTWGAVLNCGGCHGYPPVNTNHTGVVAGSCNVCHNEVNAGGTINNSTFANIQLHMNGIVDGGKCDACHGYPPVKSSDLATVGHQNNWSSARLQNYSGGGGVHAVAGHIPATAKWNDVWAGNGNCTTCHYGVNTGNTHNLYGNFSTHHVQVVIDPKFRFDKNRPIVYNGVRLGASKTTGKCSNVECHFQKTPNWSAETYTKGH